MSVSPVAVVGLERTFYQVLEDVGVVEVCAVVYSPNISCPISFPFIVGLDTRDRTAGKKFPKVPNSFPYIIIDSHTLSLCDLIHSISHGLWCCVHCDDV